MRACSLDGSSLTTFVRFTAPCYHMRDVLGREGSRQGGKPAQAGPVAGFLIPHAQPSGEEIPLGVRAVAPSGRDAGRNAEPSCRGAGRSEGDSDAVARWLAHIKVLAEEIGPRGPTTAGERRALDYCAGVLTACGLCTGGDRFTSTGSVFRPHLVAAIAILVAFALYPVALPASGLASAALVAFIMACEVMELTLRPNPLQLVPPRRPSANVYGVLAPAVERLGG